MGETGRKTFKCLFGIRLMKKSGNWDFFKVSKFLQYLIVFQIIAIILSFFPVDQNFSLMVEIFYVIYCLFLPGILILGILKINKIGFPYFLSFSIAISVAYLIAVGFLINIIFPMLGNQYPFSTSVVRYSIFLSLLLISLLTCVLNKDFNPIQIEDFHLKNFFSPFALITILLPLLSIIGAYLVIYNKANWLLLLLLIFISIIPFFLRNFVPKFIYPYLIFSIGLALMFHNSLASPFIQGSDLNSEYFYANLVIHNSYWDLSLMSSHNTLLSDVVLAPIISIFCDIQLLWIFKVIYPLLFSIGIMALYQILSEQTNEEVAFFSCFFTLSIFMVFTELLQLAKQMIAEFFLCVLILSLFSQKINSETKQILSLFFIVAIIVSHYGLTFILIPMFLFSFIGTLLLPNYSNTNPKHSISIRFLAFFLITSISWYIFIGSSSVFNATINLWDQVGNNILDLYTIKSNSPSYWLTIQLSPLELILKYFYIISVLFIVVGLLSYFILVVIEKKNKINLDFFLLSSSAIAWLAISFIVPSLVSQGSIGFSRMFQICSLFLSPFFVIGIQISVNKVLTINKYKKTDNFLSKFKDGKIIIPFFLALFLVLNSFVLAEIIKENNFDEHAISPSISQVRINEKGTNQERATINSYNKAEEDIFGVIWLVEHSMRNKKILVDSSSTAQIFISYGSIDPNYRDPDSKIIFILPDHATFVKKIQKGDYVFLRKLNTDGIMKIDFWLGNGKFDYYPTEDIRPTLENIDNKIYGNGPTIVYISRV
jgi:uncharacterized membrane protein